MVTTMSTRHRALMGGLLILCIGSILTFSLHPLSLDDGSWVRTSSTSSGSTSSSQFKALLSGSAAVPEDERVGTGARGTDLDNNSALDHPTESLSYASMTTRALQKLILGTILDTAEDLSNLSRPVRTVRPRVQHVQQSVQHQNDDSIKGQSKVSAEEGVESVDEYEPGEEVLDNEGASTDSNDEATGEPDPDSDLESGEELLDLENHIDHIEGVAPVTVNSLAQFDSSQTLPPAANYLLFVPSGETIEAQYFSLTAALWIAKHSNRTLIYSPPIMPPPSLAHFYPVFSGPRATKRQRWNTLFDLKKTSQSQPIVPMELVRPTLSRPFTAEVAMEEENPATSYQPELLSTGDSTPTSIRCQGPAAAGSWKTIDFVGRHFLNTFNLKTEFDVLDDQYWDLKPEAIQRNWGPLAENEKVDPTQDYRHGKFVCISGTEIVGAQDLDIEEMIWEEYGPLISFTRAIRLQARQSVLEVMRALEKEDRKDGYIGVHIDKLPPREVCDKDKTRSDCQWTVDLISKRIELLQQTEGVKRPVLVTTTETDLEVLSNMDRQPGWLRVGAEDDANGLFGGSAYEDLGGYGEATTRTYIMSNSAIFIGSKDSPLAVHSAFRIKTNNRNRVVPWRWELY
ncbi:hypothetical protein EMPS_09656 [Entomortierella parvispora]|uniref:Uncharacterized protein n=1 Tax=Entomortierella parvispora TaxID=205924 RepID=A0A9P3HJ88_9FUNG|nr:hypothetical protein EMPS_09656 [Entomortierella parvispora]